MRHVALLRAINVGGHVVPMARLKQLFEELGFAGVETFIASGNVIFDARPGGAPALEKRIAAYLGQALGYEVATFLRSPVEMQAIAAHRPFAKAAPGSTLYIGFLGAAPGASAKREAAALATDMDEIQLNGRELYWRCRHTISKSTVSGARLEKALGQPATLRKSTTVEKLAAKVS